MRLTTDPAEAAAALAAGRLAGLPTETVYGLGGRADSPAAVARIYAAKGRPADHPLIVHVASAEAAWQWARQVPEHARRLAEAFWPGPLTIVLERSERAGDFVTGGQATVAVRVPAHAGMRAVIDELARLTGDPAIGIAAPSANRFGRVSPTTAAHVIDELADATSDDDVVLDGGASEVGVESTIVDCTREAAVLLRPGQVSADDIEQVTGSSLGVRTSVRAPGMLASHYAPRARVLIVDEAALARMAQAATTPATASTAAPDTGLLALDSVATPAGMVRLTAPATADGYARGLYAALREADALGLATVLAVAPAEQGIGAAVIDRLTRAAAGG